MSLHGTDYIHIITSMVEYTFTRAKDVTGAFRNLYKIISLLRGEGGCPYDRAQTERSSLGNLIDEAYEYLEGVVENDREICKEELGDVMLNIVTLLQIHEDRKDFSSVDVLNDVCEKLIRRHPHVFSDKVAKSVEDGLSLWNSVKRQEGRDSSITSVLDHVPSGMPPLEKSYEIQKKLGRMGFEWTCIEDVIDKVYEELDEVKMAIAEGSQEHMEEELGDVLQTLVNLARWMKVRPDQALERANEKITRRFIRLSRIADERGIDICKENLDQLDAIWDEVKAGEN